MHTKSQDGKMTNRPYRRQLNIREITINTANYSNIVTTETQLQTLTDINKI